MKKDDLIILLIALLLLAGMIFTIFSGGVRSRHGVGMHLDEKPRRQISFQSSPKPLELLV